MIFEFKMTQQGVEMVLHALSQLPYAQSAGLIRELEGQANEQIKAAQAPASEESAPAEAAVGGTD